MIRPPPKAAKEKKTRRYPEGQSSRIAHEIAITKGGIRSITAENPKSLFASKKCPKAFFSREPLPTEVVIGCCGTYLWSNSSAIRRHVFIRTRFDECLQTDRFKKQVMLVACKEVVAIRNENHFFGVRDG